MQVSMISELQAQSSKNKKIGTVISMAVKLIDLNTQIQQTLSIMEFPNNENFGIEDIKLDANVQRNDQIEAERQTKASNIESTGKSEDGKALSLGTSSFNLKEAGHPVACVFAFAFKLSALLLYILGGFFMNNTMLFIVVLLMSAFDFWTTKNITGRLLLGLRWQVQYDQKGKGTMKFESHERQHKTNPVDVAFFWASQLVFGGIWVIMVFIKIITLGFVLFLFWFLLILLNLALISANLYAFYQCRKGMLYAISEYGQKLNDLKKLVGQKVVQGYMNS